MGGENYRCIDARVTRFGYASHQAKYVHPCCWWHDGMKMGSGSGSRCRFGRASNRSKYLHWWCCMIGCLTKNEFRE
jgi:hypothetical protein